MRECGSSFFLFCLHEYPSVSENDHSFVLESLLNYGVTNLMAERVDFPSFRILNFPDDSEKFTFAESLSQPCVMSADASSLVAVESRFLEAMLVEQHSCRQTLLT